MATKTKQTTVNLVMTIDLGGSKTKIVAQEVGSDAPKVLSMDSQLADVGFESLDSVPNDGLASERAWVGFTKPSNSDVEGEKIYYTVGGLARNRFGGLPQLYELKYELALPKILAAVWLAMVEMSLPPRFNLYLNILLPSGEMSDGDILKSRLASCLKDFDTPDGKMRVKLATVKVSSEGIGMYLSRKKSLGDKLYSISQIVVMLGFRNASAFVVRSGVIEPGNSSNFGMYWMLDFLATRVSGLDKNDPRTIKIITESTANPESLKKLSRKSNLSDIEADYQSISAAVKVAKEEYVRAIVRWLKSLGTTDEIMFCGGTAEYLRPELENYYTNYPTEIVWHGGVVVPNEFESLLGSSRLADVWALHEIFFDIINTQLVKKKKSSAAPKNSAKKANVKSSSTQEESSIEKANVEANSTQEESSTENANKKPKPYKSTVPPITANIKPNAQTNYNKRSERPVETLPAIKSE